MHFQTPAANYQTVSQIPIFIPKAAAQYFHLSLKSESALLYPPGKANADVLQQTAWIAGFTAVSQRHPDSNFYPCVF